MERDFEEFKRKYDSVILPNKGDRLLFDMYAFGVLTSSVHIQNLGRIKINSKEDCSELSYNLLKRIKWGASDLDDLEDNFEAYSAMFDTRTKNIDTNEYLILRAIEFNRPQWGIFYLLGSVQGQLNYNKYEVKEYELYTKSDCLQCFSYTNVFSTSCKEKIRLLFNHFDERGFTIEINKKNEFHFVSD